jgi:hypothetical protein
MMGRVPQNPSWAEEELLLAYWVLKCRQPERLSARDATVRRLSDVLIELPIHPSETRLGSFREPDGVRRRLTYLQALDRGDKVSGHELYGEVVEGYREHPEELDRAARRILEAYGIRWD